MSCDSSTVIAGIHDFEHKLHLKVKSIEVELLLIEFVLKYFPLIEFLLEHFPLIEKQRQQFPVASHRNVVQRGQPAV